MLIKGVVESKPSQGTFGCIVDEYGTEYLFEGGSVSEGQTVTFKVYLEAGRFKRAKNIKNYLQTLEDYYWVFIEKREGSDESVELDHRLHLLKHNTMDLSKSRTATIALEKLSR